MLPPKDRLTILFAHAAYPIQDRFALRNTGIATLEARTRDELDARIAQADVLLVLGPLAQRPDPQRAKAALRAVDQRRHGSVRQARRSPPPASASPARRASTRAPCRNTRWR